MEVAEECFLVGYPNIIPYDCCQKIIEQMKHGICKIIIGEERGTGFFCKIPFQVKENILPVLITNNHIIDDKLLNDKNGNIIIKLKEEELEKNLNLSDRIKYTSIEYDTTIIEIKENDNINKFMELDEGIINDIINNKNENIQYKDETIYIIQYPEGKLSVSFGILKEIFEDKRYNFLHKCSTRKGSSGSPIINLKNKIIGIHRKGYDKNYNEGTFLNYPIKEFISIIYDNEFKNKNIFNVELNVNLNEINNSFLSNKDENIYIEDNFIKNGSILFKKYKIINKLKEGHYGIIYKGSIILTNEPVTIKIESKKTHFPTLETEAYFLYALRGVGIPEVLSFGRRHNYNILVEPLLGKSLFDIFLEYKKRVSLDDICLISKQIIDRIQWIHSKGFIHRDIKPDNFLIGRLDPNIIYLIDFGLSKKYKSDKTGKHIKLTFTGKLIGTIRFASVNALRGGEQSRKDDLESIIYMIIFLIKGKLPWQGVKAIKKNEKYLKIYKMKKNITPIELSKSLPKQITEFIKYIKQLKFDQEPDYNFLRGLFLSILKERIININSLNFSWIKSSELKKLKKPLNLITRKSSPQARLCKKIFNNLKERKNYSNDNLRVKTSLVNNNKYENFNFREEEKFKYNNYEAKKETSKEDLDSLLVNLNKTIDENINFDDTEK